MHALMLFVICITLNFTKNNTIWTRNVATYNFIKFLQAKVRKKTHQNIKVLMKNMGAFCNKRTWLLEVAPCLPLGDGA